MPNILLLLLCAVPYIAIGVIFAKFRIKRFWMQVKEQINYAGNCDWSSCHDNRYHVRHRALFAIIVWPLAVPLSMIIGIVSLILDILDKEIHKQDPFRAEREIREAEDAARRSVDELERQIDAEKERMDFSEYHKMFPENKKVKPIYVRCVEDDSSS